MNKNSADTRVRSTTVLLVRRNGEVAMAGDGQVTLGETVIKGKARKVRRLGGSGEILAGFAGSTADAFTLLSRFETKLEQYQGQLERAAIELREPRAISELPHTAPSLVDAPCRLAPDAGSGERPPPGCTVRRLRFRGRMVRVEFCA